MAFDFPSSPTNGQEFTPAGGPTYVWQGYAWVMKLAASPLAISFRPILTSQVYVPPAGLLYAIIETIAGGAGGGGCDGVSGQFRAGGGGGSGGYSRRLLSGAAIGASQTVTIGTGGAGGLAGNNVGGDGGDTSFGTLCIAKGGKGGANGWTQNGSGGAGGSIIGAVGDIVAAGAPGGGGGYDTGGQTPQPGGNGGSSVFGGGAAPPPSSSANAPFPGVAASNYGSGGSGGMTYSYGAGAAGGDGSAGVCFITEYVGSVTGGIPEPANDGKYYARRNLAWADIAPAPVAIASAVAPDFSVAQVQAFTAAVAGAFTIANPSADANVGAYVSITITWTAAGTVTFGNKFKGLGNYVQSVWTSGTVRDHIVFRWSGSTYDLVGAAKGINL